MSSKINQYAACLLQNGQYDKLEALLSGKENGNILFYYKALSLARKGDYAAAVDILIPVIDENPDHADSKKLAFNLQMNLASLALNEKRMEDFSGLISSAMAVSPNDSESLKVLQNFNSLMAISLIKTGKRDQADKIWEDELQKGKKDKSVIQNIALVNYWGALRAEKQNQNSFSDSSVNSSIGQDSLQLLWRKAIKYWALMVSTDEFWSEWITEKQENWGVILNEEDISAFKSSLLNEKIKSVLLEFYDFYVRNNSDEDAHRIKSTQALLDLESKSSRLWSKASEIIIDRAEVEISGQKKLFEIVRGIQLAIGEVSCFGTKTTCDQSEACIWAGECLNNKNKNVNLGFKGGSIFNSDFGMGDIIYKICLSVLPVYPDKRELSLLRTYFISDDLALIYTLVNENNDIDYCFELFDLLPESIRNTIEARFVYARILLKSGNKKADKKDFEDALNDWTECWNLIEADKNDGCFGRIFSELGKTLTENVDNYISNHVATLQNDKKITTANQLINKTLKVFKPKRIIDIACTLNNDKGYQQLNAKKFTGARTAFSCVLGFQNDNVRARKGMALAYNNEAVTFYDRNKAIDYYTKALVYHKSDKMIIKNFEGAMREKVEAVLRSYSSSRAEIQNTISMVRAGLEAFLPENVYSDMKKVNSYDGLQKFGQKWLLMKKHKFDPHSENLLDYLERLFEKKENR